MVKHDVHLRGATIDGTVNPAPVLLGRQDPDFLAAMLREYRTASLKVEPPKTVIPSGSAAKPALLYQPVQRVMYVALMEAFCDTPGSPGWTIQKSTRPAS